MKVAQFRLSDVQDQAALEKLGSTYFRLIGTDQLVRTAANARVQQGRLEMANGAPAEHAIRLVTIMRQFESLQKALSISAEMSRKSVEEVARVSS
jgi:flagellar basal-body rod protein FlgG